MKLNRTKNASRNIFWGVINQFVTLILPFIIRTIIIRYLGIEYAGLNSLFTSILQVLSLAELGIGSAITFNMYKPIVEDDTEMICTLLNAYKKIYRVIGYVIMGIGLVLLPFIKYLVSGTHPTDINIYILYLIYLFNTVISYFLFSYKTSLLNAFQRNDIVSNIDTILHTIIYLIQVIVLLTVKNYYVYIIFTPICTVFNNILIGIITTKIYPQYTCYGYLGKKQYLKIFNKVKALVGHKMGGIVIISVDSIVVSAFLGLKEVAIYGNYYYVITAISGILNIVYQGILAGVGNAIASESVEKAYKLFNELSFIVAWIVGFCSVCFLCLFQHFMILWVGEKFLFAMSSVVFLVVYFYSEKIRIIGLNFKDASGMWEADFWKPYVGIVINLSTNIFLVKRIGINGVFISTILVMQFVYFPWETYVLFKYLFKKSATPYLIRYILYVIITATVCFITYSICSLFPETEYLWLFVKLIICCIVSNAMFLVMGYRTEEFQSLKSKFISK